MHEEKKGGVQHENDEINGFFKKTDHYLHFPVTEG